MLEMNKVMLIGNLTRDPELSYIASGAALAKMGLAVNRRYTNRDGENQDETAFVDIDAWGKTAEFCGKWLKKGTRVYIEGRLKFRSWEAQDGSKRNKLDVTAERVQFVLPKSHEDQQQGDYQAPGPPADGYGNAQPPQAPPTPQAQAPASPGEAFPPPQQTGTPPAAEGVSEGEPTDNTADDLPF